MIPRFLTNGNGDLSRDGIWTWTLPAWVTELPDGRTVNTCPSAGVCAPLCYARKGSFQFGNVKAAHQRNLVWVLDRLPRWERIMMFECRERRMYGKWVRIHDAGDFFSDDYLAAWLRIIRAAPRVRFYAYTKEVDRCRRLVDPDPPPNLTLIYSYGGRQDDTILPTDRRCDVFPDDESLLAAGFHDQGDSDLLAVTGPREVGIVVNKHPGMVKAMDGKAFSALQAGRHKR